MITKINKTVTIKNKKAYYDYYTMLKQNSWYE